MRIRKTVTLDTNLEGFANPEDVQKYMDQNDLKTLSAALKSLMDEHHQLSQQVTQKQQLVHEIVRELWNNSNPPQRKSR